MFPDPSLSFLLVIGGNLRKLRASNEVGGDRESYKNAYFHSRPLGHMVSLCDLCASARDLLLILANRLSEANPSLDVRRWTFVFFILAPGS
jgi:hypothetical protein